MFDFEYYTPTRVVFGKGAENKLGDLLAQQGCKRVLLHYGGGSAERSGLLGRIREIMRSAGVTFCELGGVKPNPRLSLVYRGIDTVRREGLDFILAVGGGSVIDSAKAIGYGAANDFDVWELYNHTRTAKGCLPIGAVLTIAAAGSEMSSSSVITRDEGGIKRSYGSDLCRLRFAVMDPELTMTLPPYQTACGCTDIIMHTMERYLTNGGNMELTDGIAEALMRTVMKCALILMDDPLDYGARAEVMWASSLSHNGLTGCGSKSDFVTHSLEHELGGMFDVAHGAGLSAVWGSWARYVMHDCLPRFEKFAVNVMGISGGSAEDTALRGIEAMERFYHKIGMPISIKELGIDITDEQISELSRMCAEAVGGSKGSARIINEEDMRKIYTMARG